MCHECRATATVCLLLLAAAVPAARLAAADRPERPAPPFAAWGGVNAFTAEGSAVDHGWARENERMIWGDTQTVTAARFRFELKRSGVPGQSATWQVVDCDAHGTVNYFSRGGTPWRKSDHWWKATFEGPTRREGNLTMDLGTGKWTLITSSFMEKPYRVVGHHHREEYQKVDDWPLDFEQTHAPGLFIRGILPAGTKPGVLAGTAFNEDLVRGNPDRGSRRTYRAVMWPSYRDVECVVEIDRYAKWLPRAVVGAPGIPGSRLLVRATLKAKDGDPKAAPRAARFRFELADTSREPGIAMNHPRFGDDGAAVPKADPVPDLRLNLFGSDGELSDQAQKAAVRPVRNADGWDAAWVAVDAYDFGGWSHLHVVCELADGRQVVGVLKLPTGPTADIPLPKRSYGSKIADAWRAKYKLGTNDAEDGDDRPIGDQNRGDGFSNYEEYRGFVVNGQHVRTAPMKKDLFVRNRMGPAARRGLALFESLTDLDVHPTIRESEMTATRVVNPNRSTASPRSTKESQHGLVLVYLPGGGASYIDVPDNVLWRPKNVVAVRVLRSLARGGAGSSAPFLADDQNQLDSTIAHELSHSIGARHHGEIDTGKVAWVRFEATVAGRTTAWFEERPVRRVRGRNQYSPAPGARIRIFTSPTTEVSPDVPGPYAQPQMVWVGVYGGQHSGSDACVMRYDCSEAYVLPGRPRDRFVSPGEPTGMGMCRAAAGAGINDPAAKPPRYATATKGDCVHQFAVRDDAPDRGAAPGIK